MNRRPSLSSRRRTAAFTLQQKLVLLVAGILCMGWLVVAVLFIRSLGSPAPTPAPIAQVSQETPAAVLPNQAPAPSSAQAEEQEPANPGGPGQQSAFSCARQYAGGTQATVRQVFDTGALEVQAGEERFQVKLAGISLPPTDQGQALQALQDLLAGKTVWLFPDQAPESSPDGQARYVFVGDQLANFELVRYGFAQANPASAHQACLAIIQQAEEQARLEKLGMWKPTPVPTATFMPLVTLDPSTQAGCDCSKKYECSDFTSHAAAQTCFNACNDYNSRLDEDRDGIACEWLP